MSEQEERVLILAPTGRDAHVLCAQLSRRVIAEVAADVQELCSMAARGVGVVLITEEALRRDALNSLAGFLRAQPPWSDVPVIMMAGTGETTASVQHLSEAFRASGSLTLLERPVRLVTLFSVIESALRARRRQYEVRNLLAETRLAVEQRDRFLAMLGHELRNPLAAVVNSVSILRRVGPADPEVVEQCDIIARQSTHMARLVDDLLDVARITAGKIVLDLRTLDLREVVLQALQAVKLATGPQRHEMVVDTPGEAVWVEADPVRMEQVVLNLLTNAVKYTPDRGRITVRVWREEPSAVISVVDNGEGLTAEIIERIFDPFVQASQTLERSKGGLGMGLTVVRALVELHGGQIAASSNGPGCGSEFRLVLPVAPPKLATPAPPDSLARAKHARHILLVEDNPDSRRTLAKFLRISGHRVDTAPDGVTGLQKALESRPEVALLDIGLPGMDGFELARQIRASLDGAIRLIALTGYGRPEDRQLVQEAGFDLHLVKPVEPDRLNDLLDAMAPARSSPAP